MGLKLRLIVMSFLQFMIWGAWLITIGVYWFESRQWGSTEFGAVFSTLGIASILMPALVGIIADKWINAEKLYGVLHILSGAAIFSLTLVNEPSSFFWVMLVAMFFYMPTIALSNSVAYTILKSSNLDVIKAFPPIRVWGTVGFIAAMWITNLTGNKATELQFYFSAAFSMILGVYSFTLPACPPPMKGSKEINLVDSLGLNAFKLFANYKMALFFMFSMLLGAALQLTNMYGDTYLSDFQKIPQYADSFVVRYSTIIMSISQISETVFILAIPFVLKRFGIKNVMLMSMAAWVLRFALFGMGNPDDRLWMIILSMVVYGLAFDFFNISGSLFIENNTHPSIRSSAQGLFMMMTNGFGAIMGSFLSGFLIDRYFTLTDGMKDWQGIWFVFTAYAAVVMILFAVLFKHKHVREE
jgi:NHS family xanthosine MFS transporter